VFNAERIGCALEPFPIVQQIYRHCMQLEAFRRAAPAAQGDAE